MIHLDDVLKAMTGRLNKRLAQTAYALGYQDASHGLVPDLANHHDAWRDASLRHLPHTHTMSRVEPDGDGALWQAVLDDIDAIRRDNPAWRDFTRSQGMVDPDGKGHACLYSLASPRTSLVSEHLVKTWFIHARIDLTGRIRVRRHEPMYSTMLPFTIADSAPDATGPDATEEVGRT